MKHVISGASIMPVGVGRFKPNRLAAIAASIAASVVVGLGFSVAMAQTRPNAPPPINKERLNQNTVTVVTGNPNGTYFALGYDMTAVLDAGDDMRILAIIGKGGAQNVKDALFLRGVDMGITQSAVMSLYKKNGELGPGIEDRLVYIAKLYNEEMHLLVGTGINDIKQLNGTTVNFSDAGSGTQLMTRAVFEALGIKVKEINIGQADAMIKLKSGEISATSLVAGKPSGAHQKMAPESGFKFLPIPYVQALETDYYPAKLTHEDYPTLIPKGATIDTVAAGAVLAAYNWPRGSDRHRRLARFTEQFFSKFPEFKKSPRHPKWKEASISATVPGWKRFSAAQDWIDSKASVATAAVGPTRSAADWINANSTAAGAAGAGPAEVKKFESFLAEQKTTSGAAVAPKDAEEERVLFQKFLEWSKRQ
jgi:uncharacterized protein